MQRRRRFGLKYFTYKEAIEGEASLGGASAAGMDVFGEDEGNR